MMKTLRRALMLCLTLGICAAAGTGAAMLAPAAEEEGTPAVKLKSFATNGLINSADASVPLSVLENTIEAADFTALIFSE